MCLVHLLPLGNKKRARLKKKLSQKSEIEFPHFCFPPGEEKGGENNYELGLDARDFFPFPPVDKKLALKVEQEWEKWLFCLKKSESYEEMG